MRMKLLSAAVASVAAIAVVVPTAATAGTTMATTATKPKAAAGWLAGQFVDGNHLEVVFGGTAYPDAGLTIDAILGFAATKSAKTAGGNAITWLAQPTVLSGYIGDGVGESYAGATAKATLAAQVRGLNPTSFGGVDLPGRLRALQTPSGRFSDQSAYGDYSNAFTQALAVIALRRTPGGVSPAAVDFLAGTQCADGGFPITFGAPTCAGDTDATAIVTQALQAAGRNGKAQQGLSWLVGKQQANGGISVGNGDLTVAPNANTTGLAGQALRAGGRAQAANKARTFLLSLQVGCAGAEEERGAIAYDATGFNPDTAPRATAQAVLGLGGPGLATLTAAGSTAQAPTLAC